MAGAAVRGLIDRHDLVATLDRAARERVTIISAPAGSGRRRCCTPGPAGERDEREAASCPVGLVGDPDQGAEPTSVAEGQAGQIEQQQPGTAGDGAAPLGQAVGGGQIQFLRRPQDRDPGTGTCRLGGPMTGHEELRADGLLVILGGIDPHVRLMGFARGPVPATMTKQPAHITQACEADLRWMVRKAGYGPS